MQLTCTHSVSWDGLLTKRNSIWFYLRQSLCGSSPGSQQGASLHLTSLRSVPKRSPDAHPEMESHHGVDLAKAVGSVYTVYTYSFLWHLQPPLEGCLFFGRSEQGRPQWIAEILNSWAFGVGVGELATLQISRNKVLTSTSIVTMASLAGGASLGGTKGGVRSYQHC